MSVELKRGNAQDVLDIWEDSKIDNLSIQSLKSFIIYKIIKNDRFIGTLVLKGNSPHIIINPRYRYKWLSQDLADKLLTACFKHTSILCIEVTKKYPILLKLMEMIQAQCIGENNTHWLYLREDNA